MSIAFVLLGIVGLVWWMALQKHLSIITASLLVVLVGVTFGYPFFKFNIGPIPVTIDRILWAGLIALTSLFICQGRSRNKPLNHTDILVICLAIVVIASTFFHDWSYQDKLPLSRLLFFQLMPIGFYIVARSCEIQNRHLTIMYVSLAVFGLYLSSTAILEQREIYALVFPRFIIGSEFQEFVGRARGPFLNPVSCGIYLLACLTAATFLWDRAKPLLRLGLAFLVAACLVAALLTLTRSVWLSCAVTVGILCWFPALPQVRGGLIVAATVLLVLGSLTLSPGQLNRFKRDKHVSEAAMSESATLRPLLAHVAIKMARDKPLLGHGLGQYTAAKEPYHYTETEGRALTRVLPYVQHNVFLSYLTELGFTGMILLMLLLGTLTIKSWRLWQAKLLPKELRQFGLMGMVFASAFVINGMFHDVSIIPHVGSLFFLTLGIANNLYATHLSVNLPRPQSFDSSNLDAPMAA